MRANPFRPLASATLALLLACASTAAASVELGSLHIRTALGAPLRAEIELRGAKEGELDTACFRIRRLAGSGTTRARTDVALGLISLARRDILEVTTRLPVNDPLVFLTLDVACGEARAWEYAIPISPPSGSSRKAGSDDGAEVTATAFVAPGRWRIRPGESLDRIAHTLFPRSRAMREQFIGATRRANPDLPSGDSTVIAPGSELVIPDLRALALLAVPKTSEVRPPVVASESALRMPPVAKASIPVAPARKEPVSRALVPPPVATDRPAATPVETDSGALHLRLATTLGSAPHASERQRDLLRLEYRLITAINIQARTQREIIDKLRAAEETNDALRQLGAPVMAAAGTAADVPVPREPSPAPLAPQSPSIAQSAPAPTTATSSSQPVVPQPTAGERVASANAPGSSEPVPRIAGRESPSTSYERLLYATLLLVLGGGVAWLVAGMRRSRRRAESAIAEAADDAALAQGFETGPPSYRPAPVRAEPPAANEAARSPTPPAEVSADNYAATVEPADPTTVRPTDAQLEEFKEDRTVVELAEMMMAFGRIKGAAELLHEYINVNPGEALKPWVMLLDVYRQANMAAEFEKAAWRLHKHFNVQVEEWDHAANLSFVARSIEAYPHIVQKIVATWRTPACLEYLHHLLRDNRAGERSGFTRDVAEDIALLIDLLERDPEVTQARAAENAN